MEAVWEFLFTLGSNPDVLTGLEDPALPDGTPLPIACLPIFLIFLIVIPICVNLFYYHVFGKKRKPTQKNWFFAMFVAVVLCYVVNFLIGVGFTNVKDDNLADFILFLFTTPLIYSLIIFVVSANVIKGKSEDAYHIPVKGSIFSLKNWKKEV